MEQLIELQQNINESVKQVLKDHELYLTVKGFSNYEVSNFGNVRNKTTKHILKPIMNQGNCQVSFSVNTIVSIHLIHDLVANAFLNNYDNKDTIIHIDGNRKNNNLQNLRFGTKEENVKKQTKKYRGVRKIYRDGVKQYIVVIPYNGGLLRFGFFDSEEEAAEQFNVQSYLLFGDFAYLNDI